MTRMALVLVAALCIGAPALADSANPDAGKCLRSTDILNTTVPNDRTILFRMRDGTTYRNDLRTLCPQLKFNGFAYTATPPDDICGNLQSIRVIRTGAVCLLGPFTKVEPAPKSDAAH